LTAKPLYFYVYFRLTISPTLLMTTPNSTPIASQQNTP